jgi:pyruvate formate lyase activating enzyme
LKCVEACATGALDIVGKYMRIQDVVGVIEQDRPFYSASDGGVTLSGGEPTLQFSFSKALLEECRKRGISTAIETSGYCSWRKLDKLSEFVDLFLFDIKVLHRNKHFLLTSVSNEIILRNLEELAKSKRKIVIRYPLIPQHNDMKGDIKALAIHVRNLNLKYDAISEVDLLPYHRYGTYKYHLLGVKYKLENLAPPTDTEISKIKKLLSETLNINIQIGG